MNYIGSKYSLLSFLDQAITEVTGFCPKSDYIFADLFAGTGVVGAFYREKGCKVITNDIQYYSYVLNKHKIENIVSINRDLLNYLNGLDGIEGFVYKNYCMGSGSGRNYFTNENGMKCDAIRTVLEKLYYNKEIDESTYFFFLASLIDSIDKVANTASVYGAFLKHIKKSAQKSLELQLLPIINGEKGKVYNEDINQLIYKVSGDILYLDPPYNARQYCANYHVLETISRYDNPLLKGKTGLRDYTAQKSAFCSKKTATLALDTLIKNARFKYIFLSYNNEGLIELETIRDIMKKNGSYRCYTKEYKRFQADKEENRNIQANTTVEYLHCLKKEI